MPAGVAEVPLQGRLLVADQGERVRARTPRPGRGRSRARRTASASRVVAELTRTGGGIAAAAALGGQQAAHGGRVEGVGADRRRRCRWAARSARRAGRPGWPHRRRPRAPRRCRWEVARSLSPPSRGHRASRAVVKRARPARSAWSRTSVQRPVAANTAGADSPCTSACSKPTTPPGRSSTRGTALEHPDRVEAVGAGEEREVRVVVAGLRRHRLPGLERDVRRVAGDDVDGAGEVVEGGRHVALAQVDARAGAGCAPPRRAPPRPARRRARRAPGTSSTIALAIAPEPVQRSTTTGASSGARLLDRPAGQQLGLGAGHEDARARRRARRGGSTPTPVRCWSGSRPARRATSASNAVERRRGDVVDQRRAASAWCRGRGRAARRRRAPGWRPRLGAAGRSPPASAARRGRHCSSASRRAARSASMQESRTGWRSPSSTWSRL